MANARGAAEHDEIEEAGAFRYQVGWVAGLLAPSDRRREIAGRLYSQALVGQVMARCDFLERCLCVGRVCVGLVDHLLDEVAGNGEAVAHTYGGEHRARVEQDMKTLDMRAQTIGKPTSEINGSVARRAAAHAYQNGPDRCSRAPIVR